MTSNHRWPGLWSVLLLLMLTMPSVAEWPFEEDRQRFRRPVSFGARVGQDYDGDTASAGAQLRVPVPRLRGLTLAPSADIYNDGDGADWQVNVDLLLSPGPQGGIYLGIGFGWVEEGRAKRERAGNQVLGLQLPVGRRGLRAFVEGRWTELDRDTVFRLVGGLSMPLFRY